MVRRRGHSLTWCLAASGGLLAASVLAFVLWQRSGKSTTQPLPLDAGPLRPSVAGAYVGGGRPTGGLPALDRAFGKDLPAYIIALDEWSQRRRAGNDVDTTQLVAARDAVLAPDTQTALGDSAYAALTALLDRARDVALAPSSKVDRAADEFSRAVLALDDQLGAAGLGYLVDSDVMEYQDDGRRLVLLFSFTVEHVAIYGTSAGDVRALQLRRLDQLNWTYTLLGFTSPRRHDALILVEQVDERLVDRVLPQLGSDPPPFYVLEESERQNDWYPRLAERATEMVRADYGPVVAEPTSAVNLGELLARRKNLFLSWERNLLPRGISISAPTTLRLDWDFESELSGLIDERGRAALEEIEKGLASEDAAAGFARARQLLIESIERHEVQHRIDNMQPKPLPMPPALKDFVGPLTGPRGEKRQDAEHAVAELSAYLAELARDTRTSGAGLTILTQFAVAPAHWGTAECYAALVIFEELAEELHLPVREPLVEAHTIDRSRVTDAYIALTNVPRDELQAAAKRLWERLFERPLDTLEKKQ